METQTIACQSCGNVLTTANAGEVFASEHSLTSSLCWSCEQDVACLVEAEAEGMTEDDDQEPCAANECNNFGKFTWNDDEDGPKFCAAHIGEATLS